jgi:hypothetical protein
MRRYYDLLEQTGKEGPPQYHMHSDIVAAFRPEVLTQLRELIAEAGRAVESADEVYRRRLEFVTAGFRLADRFISANHLKSEYARTKDADVRRRIIAMYKEVLATIEDPRYANRLVENRIAVPPLERELATLEAGTAFGVGDFSYADGYERGGKSSMDAVRTSGFRNGVWGLDMPKGGSAQIVYDFGATDGVFGAARITKLLLGARGSVRIEVADTPDGPWELVAQNQSPDADTEVRIDTPLDLTSFIRGKKRFFLRMALSNEMGDYCCAIDTFRIEGKVTASVTR